jgi:hypothetical protein
MEPQTISTLVIPPVIPPVIPSEPPKYLIAAFINTLFPNGLLLPLNYVQRLAIARDFAAILHSIAPHKLVVITPYSEKESNDFFGGFSKLLKGIEFFSIQSLVRRPDGKVDPDWGRKGFNSALDSYPWNRVLVITESNELKAHAIQEVGKRSPESIDALRLVLMPKAFCTEYSVYKFFLLYLAVTLGDVLAENKFKIFAPNVRWAPNVPIAPKHKLDGESQLDGDTENPKKRCQVALKNESPISENPHTAFATVCANVDKHSATSASSVSSSSSASSASSASTASKTD